MADPRIGEAFVEIRPDTSGFRRATQAQVRTQLAPVGAGLRGAGLGAIAATSAVAGLTTAVTILGVRTVKAGIDFESSFAGVRKTVDATEAEFSALADSFRDLAREIPVNVNQLNELGEAAGALGIQKNAIVDFVEVAAQLGVTTNLAAQDAANALARIANITQLPQDQFDNLGSTIVDLGNKMATTEAELVEFGLRIAGAGKIAGLTDAQILAIGATLSSMGVEAEAGGTAVQKVLINMSNSAKIGGKQAKAFADIMGLTVAQFQNLQQTDPQAAFQRFVQGLHDVEESGGAATVALDSVGLADQRLIRSFLALSGNTALLDQAFRTANDAFKENTALTEEARKRFETTSAQIQLLRNNLNDLAISISSAALPGINGMLSGLSGLVDRLRESEDAQGFADDLRNAFDLAKRAFNVIRPDIERLIGVVRRNIETWRILFRVMRPVTILVGATLVVAFKAAVRVIDLVSQAMNVLAKAFREGVQIIVGAIDGILGALSSMADAASNIPFVGDQFAGVADKINAARDDLREFSTGLDDLDGKTVDVIIAPRMAPFGGGSLPVQMQAPFGGGAVTPGTTTGGTGPRGTTGATPRGSQVPSALRTELTSATRAREQRLLDEAELARLTAQTQADDRRTLNALIAFYRELANSDRFTVAAKRAFLIEQKRFQSELAQLDADAAQAARDQAESDRLAREDAASARAEQVASARADRLEILQTNLELARLTQLNLNDDRRALRALIAYWHEIARLKGISALERRRAVLAEKQAIADLKSFNQDAVRNRISEQESLLRDRLTLAQLTDKTERDDEAALRKLIAFYRKQSRNQKLTRAERRRYLIELRRAQKELRELGSGSSGATGSGPSQAQRNFEFLGSLQGVFRDFGSNLFQPGQISVGRVDPSTAGRMKSIASKIPGIKPGERTSMAAEAADKLREGRGMTGSQAAELIHLQRQTVRLLADLHRGAGHPENRYATHSARASMDHRE